MKINKTFGEKLLVHVLLLILFKLTQIKCIKNKTNKSDCLDHVFRQIGDILNENHQVISIKNYDSEKLVIESILRPHKDKPYKITNFNKSSSWVNIEESAILTFQSVNSLIDFNKKTIFTNVYPKKMQFFVYCQDSTIEDILPLRETSIDRPIFSINFGSKPPTSEHFDRTDIIHHEYFVLETEGFFRLLTFVWYTPRKCNEPELIEINRFNKSTMAWNSPAFEIKKFHNFHGCTLIFGVPPNTDLPVDILQGLSTNLNFSMELKHENASINPNLYMNNTMDLSLRISCNSLNLINNTKVFISQPFYSCINYLAVSPGDEYSSYEKLPIPFHQDVWMVIGGIFIFAYLVIMILRFMKSHHRDLVFGENVTTPSLNVSAIFFGISQTTLPKKNFARILVVIYNLYCLIIRTSYQGKSFEFMQSEIRKPGVESIDEMIANNFSFNMLAYYPYSFSGSDIMKRQVD